MRQVKISFLSSKLEMVCIGCRIFAGSDSCSARKSLPIHQRRSHKRLARVMPQRNGALPLDQWGKSGVREPTTNAISREAGALLLASGSVDQKNTYVFQVLPRAASESLAQVVSYWSTGKGDDTMVTLWNPADEDRTLYLLFSSAADDTAIQCTSTLAPLSCSTSLRLRTARFLIRTAM
jgi:hypothetical protein